MKHPFEPDAFFNAEQCERLQHLMSRFRTAGDAGTELPGEEQRELELLVETELEAAAARAAAMVNAKHNSERQRTQ